ncbi:hypothetical protein AB0F18_20680, partial [Streptomyces sp. NPDC029216]
MAGESPDKSVSEGASGAAKSSGAGEQDPRLSVFQPRVPLKDAVPARAAGAGASDGAPDEDAEVAPAAEPSPGRVDPAPSQAKPGVGRQGSASDDSDNDSDNDSENGSDPARGDSAPADTPDADSGSDSGSGSAQPGPSTDDRDAPPASKPRSASGDTERTAVFRTVKPGTRPAASGSGAVTPDPAPEDAPAAGKPSAASERTAVFRTVKPGSASDEERPSDTKPSAGTRTTAFGVATSDPAPEDAPGAGKPAADPRAAKPSAESERTAVFRTVKPGSASADSAEAGDEER